MPNIRCEICGGNCKLLNSKEYKCMYCGNTFDIAPEPTVASVVTPKNYGESVFENCIGSVIEITCNYSDWRSAGSGFIINKDGFAITNTHVVTENCDPCKDIAVVLSGKSYCANVVALGDSKGGHGQGVDLALIKISASCEMKAVKLCNTTKIKNGSRVYVIGNSLGQGTCITSGIISDKSRIVSGKQLIMTDCAINGGNSGGPMFNEKSEVVGAIVSSIKEAKGMNFAIPTSTIIAFVDKLSERISTLKKTLNDCGFYGNNHHDCDSSNAYADFRNDIKWCDDCDGEW